MQCWIAPSLRRFYPASPAEEQQTLTLDAGRGERLSFQALARTAGKALMLDAAAESPAELDVRVRRAGWVPLPHFNTDTPAEELEGLAFLPGFVPDPLLPETQLHAGPFETHAYWVTVRVPADSPPGRYPVTVRFSGGDATGEVTATVVVHPAVVPARQGFPVTHWFYADALLDWYGLAPFEETFWPILDRYLADIAEHGQDTIYVPAFTPPLDGVKRPTQLLGVTRDGDHYRFDWSLVRRWIQAAEAQGIRNLEWTHLFTQWGAANAIRVYEGHGADEKLLWPAETGATSAVYRDFLGQYLPALERFLRDEGLMEQSFFHLSDEPHGDQHLANYRAARALLRELAPWMRIMDALSEIAFAREGLTDQPIPSITTAPQFVAEGFEPWAYFCCGPRGRYLNRLLDTPLQKIRMSGWLLYATGVRGFLHWGYNYWYESQTRKLIDPYQVTDGLRWPGWAHGDTFMVYPGKDGPVDSLRWEVFAESLQDYALLQAAGVDRADPLLAGIKDFQEFPRDPGWVPACRAELLRRLGG